MTTKVQANGIEICYETQGTGDPLLLVMGLGGQLTDWPQAFVEKLAHHFTVIRFDNRDIGLSTYSQAPKPTRWELIKAAIRPSSVQAAYQLSDMADDAAGLLDALSISSAHVVGMSMGGMITQQLALQHPSRVTSMCSIMSHTGDRRNGRPTLRVLMNLARRGEPPRDKALDTTLELFSLIGGSDWDPDEQRQRSTASIARAYNPAGVLRQSQAIATSPDRTEALAAVSAPAAVVHGLDDRLVLPSGGVATARAIPGSTLTMFPRMGHDIPATRHDEIVDLIVRNAAKNR